MDIVDFITKYQKVLNNRIEDISVSITSGSITDIEDYRARVGEIPVSYTHLTLPTR